MPMGLYPLILPASASADLKQDRNVWAEVIEDQISQTSLKNIPHCFQHPTRVLLYIGLRIRGRIFLATTSFFKEVKNLESYRGLMSQ